MVTTSVLIGTRHKGKIIGLLGVNDVENDCAIEDTGCYLGGCRKDLHGARYLESVGSCGEKLVGCVVVLALNREIIQDEHQIW